MCLSYKDMRSLYENHKFSCASIAKLDGRSETTIYNILKCLNVKIRSRSEANQIFSDSVLINLYNMGLSYTQIAKLLGTHFSTISKRFRLLEFPARSKILASAIRYNDTEFKRYFYNKTILDDLTELVC